MPDQQSMKNTDFLPDLEPEEEQLPKIPKLKKRRNGFVLLIVILIVVVSGIAAWILTQSEKKPNKQQAGIDKQQMKVADNLKDVPNAENSETFTSSPYRITFKHPKTWTVTQANDNGIRIESQSFSYPTKTGEVKQGYFRIYVRKGARPQDSTIIGKGVVIEPSITLTYNNPTPVQRTETNVSLFGLNGSDNFAFLLVAGNYRLQKNDTLGPNYGKEIETVLISGGFSDKSLQDDMATNPVPLDYYKNTNAYLQALSIIQTFEIT